MTTCCLHLVNSKFRGDSPLISAVGLFLRGPFPSRSLGVSKNTEMSPPCGRRGELQLHRPR